MDNLIVLTIATIALAVIISMFVNMKNTIQIILMGTLIIIGSIFTPKIALVLPFLAAVWLIGLSCYKNG